MIRDVARIKAIRNQESGASLYVFPSKNIGLGLGCQLCSYIKFACGEVLDQQGLQPLFRSKNAGHFFRHAEFNSIIKT